LRGADGETPRFSVNQGMTPRLTFAEDLAAIREAGGQGVGIAAGEVGYGLRKITDDSADLERLRDSGLRAVFCNPTTPSVLPRRQRVAGVLGRGAVDPEARVDGICRDIARLAPFEPLCCICVPGPIGDYEPARAREIAAAGLKRAAQAAADYGMNLAVEPMHSSIHDEFSFLNTIPDTVDLLDEIGEPNAGIMLDVWHIWDTDNLLDHIRSNADRIIGVHLDDWRDPTRTWCDRVLPGDGSADLGGILKALRDGGYDGWFELEVLSDDGTFGSDFPDSLWKRDPVELIRAGREQFLAAWRGVPD
jgi:sugar phosphate isomerase/epimerase